MLPNAALKPRFALVTFDVTNTLLQFKNSAGIQYAKVASSYGVHCDPDKLNTAFRFHWGDLGRRHPNFGFKSGMTSQNWWNEIVTKSFRQIQPQITTKQLESISDELYRIYATEQCWKLSGNILEQLQCLKKHDIILGIISNFDERLHSVLASTGLRSFFSFVIASYEEGVEKPNRKIFDSALSKVSSLGIDASKAVHIGDDLYLDFNAARRAGWNALLLREKFDDLDCETSYLKKSIIATKDIANHLLTPVT